MNGPGVRQARMRARSFVGQLVTALSRTAPPVTPGRALFARAFSRSGRNEPVGRDLRGVNLRHADLSATNLNAARLDDADLSLAILRGVDLRGASLSDANLSDANLSDANLSDANLTNANLRGAVLVNADLKRARLRGADLGDAELSDANLRSAHLSAGKLAGAELSGANLRSAHLDAADLSGACFIGADLTTAYLRSADLSSADLRGANLTGANLTGANLTGANLTGAKLVDARLAGANLGDVDLRDVTWNSTTHWPAELTGTIRKASKELPDGTLQVREPKRSPTGVTVSDDGTGFDARAAPRSDAAAIIGVRERAALLDADLDIRREPEDDTQVRLEPSLSVGRVGCGFRTLVLLVEDHVAVRQAIAALFKREADFEVVRQANSLAQARSMLDGVDIAIVDLGLPDGWGGDLIAELHARNPRSQTLVLSASLDRAEIARAIESGAAGVLDKTARLDEVVSAVRRLRAGEALVPIDELVELLGLAARRREPERDDRGVIESLTARERQVLQALFEGLDSQQIAERLHITVRTERNHVASILAKLGVHSRLQALVFALRYDIVEIPERS